MKVDAAEAAVSKTQKLIEQAVGANLDNEKWPPKARRMLTPEQKKLVRSQTHQKAMAGKEHHELNELPSIAPNEVAPERKEQFAKATEEWIADILPPQSRRVLILLAAYADAGTQSPTVRSLAARMRTTIPNVLFLLHDLEIKGWIKVKWSRKPSVPNKYTIRWRDGE